MSKESYFYFPPLRKDQYLDAHATTLTLLMFVASITAIALFLICISAPRVYAESESFVTEEEVYKAGHPCRVNGKTYYVDTQKYSGKGKGRGKPCKDCELDCHMRALNGCPLICKLREMDRRIFDTSSPVKGSKSVNGCYMKPPGGYCTVMNRKLKNRHRLMCVFRAEIEDG